MTGTENDDEEDETEHCSSVASGRNEPTETVSESIPPRIRLDAADARGTAIPTLIQPTYSDDEGWYATVPSSFIFLKALKFKESAL